MEDKEFTLTVANRAGECEKCQGVVIVATRAKKERSVVGPIVEARVVCCQPREGVRRIVAAGVNELGQEGSYAFLVGKCPEIFEGKI